MIVIELKDSNRMYAGYRVSFIGNFVKLFVPYRWNYMEKRWVKMSESWMMFRYDDINIIRRTEERV